METALAACSLRKEDVSRERKHLFSLPVQILRDIVKFSGNFTIFNLISLNKSSIRIVNSHHFKDVDFHNTKISDHGLDVLSKLTQIESMCLRCCVHISSKGLEHLSRLPMLQELNLAMCRQLSDITPLAGAPLLRSINITGCGAGLTDTALVQFLREKSLSSAQPLLSLNLSQCVHMDGDVVMMAISRYLLQLNVLVLNSSFRITDHHVATIATLTSLTELGMRDACHVSSDALASLSTLQNLESIDLCCCHNAVDHGFLDRMAWPRLHSLGLSHISLRASPSSRSSIDAVCNTITGRRDRPVLSLTTLNLASTAAHLTEDALEALASSALVSTLTSLDISNVQCDLKALSRLTSLQVLTMNNALPMSDQRLLGLLPLTDLRIFRMFGGPRFTDLPLPPGEELTVEGLAFFVLQSHSLRFIDVRYKAFSEEKKKKKKLKHLASVAPWCKVLY
jgi:hypothetical protein